jgi:hypothetical protein
LTVTGCSKLSGLYLRAHLVIIKEYLLLQKLDLDQRKIKVLLIKLELRIVNVLSGHPKIILL